MAGGEDGAEVNVEDFDLKDYENVLEEAKCYVCRNPHRTILITLTTRFS